MLRLRRRRARMFLIIPPLGEDREQVLARAIEVMQKEKTGGSTTPDNSVHC